VSTLQDPTRKESATGDGAVPAPRTSPEAHAVKRSRVARWAVFGVAGVAVATVGALGVTRVGGSGEATAPPAVVDSNLALKDTPITLPDTVAGLAGLGTADVTADPAWRAQAQRGAGNAVFAARTYGTPGSNSIVRVVGARTDLTGKLELAWAADAGTKVGPVSCTNNTKLTPDQPAKIRPTVMLCWRTSGSLSVYALVIDPKATTPVPTTTAAQAVDSVWRSASSAS
jgi:hypothetical protein